MVKKRALIAGVVALLICGGFYLSGNIGIAADEINDAQMRTVSWNPSDYCVTGTSSGGGTLYVGVMWMKDYSDARYFIYIKKGGLSLGWHFLQSGGLSEVDGLRAFDCGEHWTAYVALNQDGGVRRIEFEDGWEPSVREGVRGPICEQSRGVVRFYDAYGSVIEPNKVTLIEP